MRKLIVAPFLLILPLVLITTSCSSSRSGLKKAAVADDEIVDVDGMAPYDSSDIPGSKAAAIAVAQRAAVELVVGVRVSAKTRVDKAVAIQNEILANVGGYVKKYQILSEGKSGDYYKVRIRALVSTQKLAEDLDSRGLLSAPPIGNPRVVVLLQEWIGEKRNQAGDASRTVTQGLINKGFRVVTLPSSVKTDEDPVELAHSLSRSQAELLVSGLARAQELGLDKKLGGMSSYRANVTLRVIEVGTGQVLSTVSQTASGLEGTPEIAGGKALSQAAELAVGDLASLPQEISKRSLVTLRVTGLTAYDKLAQLQKTLTSLKGVKDLYLRSYKQASGDVELELHVDGITPQEVAAESVKAGGAGWSVYQVEGRSIQISASPAGR